MAKFTTHVIVGAAVSGIISTSFLASGATTPHETAVCFAMGIAGSLLPDIDYNDTLILKVIFAFWGVSIASWVVWSFFIFIWSFFELFLVWTAIFLVIYFGLYAIFIGATKHRGLFHSFPAALFFWAATTYLAFWFFYYRPFACWAFGFMMFVGYITHLILDELFHVDLEGVIIKDYRWGTVFKFYSPGASIWLNILLWFAAFSIFWWCPSPYPFFSYLFSPKYYTTYYSRGYPRGGWFVYRPGTNVYQSPRQQYYYRDQYQPGRYRGGRYNYGPRDGGRY